MNPAYEPNLRSLVDLLRVRAEQVGDQLHYDFVDTDESWSVRRLETRARAIATALQAIGREGDRVLLLYPPGLEYLAAFFGCLFSGRIAVPAYPPGPRNLGRLQAIAAQAGVSVVSTISSVMAAKSVLLSEVSADTVWLASDDISTEMARLWRPHSPTEDDVAFLQYTSGSTAAPKGAIISHGNLLHQLESLRVMLSFEASDHVVSWLPPYHDMGLIGGLLTPLYVRNALTFMSPVTFLRRPARWLETISSTKATISVAPNFAYELCTRRVSEAVLETLDLASWRIMMSGAEPVRMDTMRRFVERFERCGVRWDAVYPCYGMAESTLMATGSRRLTPPKSVVIDQRAYERGSVVERDEPGPEALELACCGRSIPDQRLLIMNPETLQPVAEGTVGEIWLHSASVAQGYWELPRESEEAFGGVFEGLRYLRTGDLGFLLGDELYLSGRLKDLIVLKGLKFHPEDIEFSLLNGHPALRAGCAAVFSVDRDSEEVVLIQEVDSLAKGDELAVIDAIRRAVSTGNDVELDEICLVSPRTVPKTPSGKVQRKACKARYLAHEIEGYVWRRADIRARREPVAIRRAS